jgi:hypothetical protein
VKRLLQGSSNGCRWLLRQRWRTEVRRYNGQVKRAQLKLAATLRFGTAESQDESPTWAIHKVKTYE